MQSQIFPETSTTTIERCMVHGDLENSEYGAPTGLLDKNDYRGFYVEWLHVSMWLQTHGEAADPKKPAPHWLIMREAPNTTNQTGSITSSISYGFDASAGAMADMPTANFGGHIGVSSSHSHTLTDFTFMQHSTAQVVNHEVNMTMTDDGEPYKHASDLINQWQSPFVGIRLRDIPNMAKSNVPLVSQGVWMNNSPAGLVDKLTFHVAVTPLWLLVEGKYDGMLHHWTTAFGGTFKYSKDIDFGLLA
ncbi:MAG: hypothetical protein AAF686_05145 [Pseudomonadota bacterium]